jgi:hypothetical protein
MFFAIYAYLQKHFKRMVRRIGRNYAVRRYFFAALLSLFSLRTFPQHHEPTDSLQIAVSDTLNDVKKKNRLVELITKRRNFLVAPQFDRAPETGILTGIYYLQLYKNKKDSNTRTSNTETFLSVTQKHQYLLEFNETILFSGEKYILRGNSMLTRYNEYFFGIGNNVDLKKKDTIEFNLLQTTQRFTRVISKRMFAGIQYQYYSVYNVGLRDNSILENSAAVGKHGSTTSGLGPVFLYDTRDNVIYSRTGTYLDVSALFVRDYFGSQYDFTNITIDARKFIKFYKNDVICFQGILNYNVGDVPFRQLALMGSDIMMRGYYMGTYRDKVMACGQMEARIPVWRFVGLVLFAAAGEVEQKLSYFTANNIRITGGMGLRFMFIKHERVNVGGDLGFGKNTKALYFGSGESF